MSEKPIIFSTPMVQAILAGKKIQTRRGIKPQPAKEYTQASPLYFSPIEKKSYVNFSDVNDEHCKTFYPKYQPGDILWVRETWCPCATIESWLTNTNLYAYKADFNNDEDKKRTWTWRSPIYMPRAAARIFLRVTDVRVERLQEITIDDVISEAAVTESEIDNLQCVGIETKDEYAKHCYRELWDSLNAKRGYGWETNPYVWVISFERQ